jgi:YHS domain-containing protein
MTNAIKLVFAALFTSLIMANSALSGEYDINKTITGLALRGYDPVAYFTENKPVPGDFSITSVYNDATYRFASEEHKKMFEADPEKYLPQYGGFCAYGLANGVKVDGDPGLWKIVDEKLYLNLSPVVVELWNKDIPSKIKEADQQWPALKDAKP